MNLQESHGRLTLQNVLTNDVFEYTLRGIVKEPLAQEHLLIRCKAGEVAVRRVTLNNNTFKAISYKVETDLEQITGLSNFDVQPYTPYVYEFAVRPLAGGIYTGQITFQDSDDPNK